MTMIHTEARPSQFSWRYEEIHEKLVSLCLSVCYKWNWPLNTMIYSALPLKCSGLLWIIGRCSYSFHFPSCLILSFILLLKNTSSILKPVWGEVRLKLPTGCSFHVLPFSKTIAELYTMERLWKKQVRKAWL